MRALTWTEGKGLVHLELAVCRCEEVGTQNDNHLGASGEARIHVGKPAARCSGMPHDTDCPHPIRIWAFFEMIRPYHRPRQMSGKYMFVLFLDV